MVLAGGKPIKEEPDWGIPSPVAKITNPLDTMSFAQLKEHFAKLKAEKGIGKKKTLAEMQSRGDVKGVAIG